MYSIHDVLIKRKSLFQGGAYRGVPMFMCYPTNFYTGTWSVPLHSVFIKSVRYQISTKPKVQNIAEDWRYDEYTDGLHKESVHCMPKNHTFN